MLLDNVVVRYTGIECQIVWENKVQLRCTCSLAEGHLAPEFD